jgi:translation initiation factor IF-3
LALPPKKKSAYVPGGRRLPMKPGEGEFNINMQIRAKEVRLIAEGIEPGVYPIQRALEIADEQELDLVEISPNAEPPVCKVIDYKKFLFERKKKAKEAKANQLKQDIKEIRFGPNTDDHDFDFKLKHAEEFLKEGHKVKAYVFFKGRSIVYKERGEVLLLQFAQKLSDWGKVDMLPKLEGKKMNLIMSPKPKK